MEEQTTIPAQEQDAQKPLGARKSKGRQDPIFKYSFPEWLMGKLKDKRPNLAPWQIKEVAEGLKEWFWMLKINYGQGGLGMTSRVVDDLWHEWILETRVYKKYCEEEVGFFAHHSTNDSDLSPEGQKRQAEEVERSWRKACQLDGINPEHPRALPRLFALDRDLGIADGFYFRLPGEDASKGQLPPGVIEIAPAPAEEVDRSVPKAMRR